MVLTTYNEDVGAADDFSTGGRGTGSPADQSPTNGQDMLPPDSTEESD